MDKYEASAWQIAPSNTALVGKIKMGTVTLADLTAGGATQLSIAVTSGPPCMNVFPPNFILPTGQWTPVAGSSPPSPGIYALSIPGVLPSACVSWFQAAQLCRLSGKRLLTNLEWQDAAAGTPDPGTDDGSTDCNISTAGSPVNTGSRSKCKSNWGVFDMVGNVSEWVADWASTNQGTCTDWKSTVGFTDGDGSCFGSAAGTGGAGDLKSLPGALFRDGFFRAGASAGVLAVVAVNDPTRFNIGIGFRCAR